VLFSERVCRFTWRVNKLGGTGHYGAAKGLERVLLIKEACIIGRNCYRRLLGTVGNRLSLILEKHEDTAQVIYIGDPVTQLPPPIVPFCEARPSEKSSSES